MKELKGAYTLSPSNIPSCNQNARKQRESKRGGEDGMSVNPIQQIHKREIR